MGARSPIYGADSGSLPTLRYPAIDRRQPFWMSSAIDCLCASPNSMFARTVSSCTVLDGRNGRARRRNACSREQLTRLLKHYFRLRNP
jgi:hypothetical protein